MKYKSDTSVNFSFLANWGIIFMSVLIFALSNIYKYLIKKPVRGIFNRVIEPMVNALDDEYIGLILIGVFIIEVLLTLIIPWFFSMWVGIMCVVYLFLYFIYLIFVINEDINSKLSVSFFLIFSLPYLVLLFLPALFVVFFRKRPYKQLSLLETRIIKLKKLKRKVKHNKLKFWKK